jgi:hypothetical protein
MDVGVVSLYELYNYFVDESVVLVDVRDDVEESLRFAVRVGDSDAVRRRLKCFQVRRVAVIVLFGSAEFGSANVASALAWLEREKYFELRPMVLKEAPDKLVDAYPFLGQQQQHTRQLPHRITKDIFLGDASSARNTYLTHFGIRAIVNAAGYEYTGVDGVRIMLVNVMDMPSCDIAVYFDRVFAFVDEAIARG